MKKNELLDLGAQSEGDAIVKATVPPADVRRIFGAVILRIENQHFAAFEEMHQFLLRGARDASYLRAQGMNRAAIRFVIGQVGDGFARGGNAEPGATAGMIQLDRAHGETADRDGGFGEFIDPANSGQRFERDGELDRIHLPNERGTQPFARAGRAEDADLILRCISRPKKGQSLDMIPVSVRNEQSGMERFLRHFIHQEQAEAAQTAPGIEDEHFIAQAQLDAGGVATVADGFRTRGRDGTTHAPEAEE